MDDFGLPTPPTPPAPQPVPQPETPVIVTPKKKFSLKLAAGALIMLLLIGGAYLGISQVQKKQTAESQAEGNICSGGVAEGESCWEFCQICRQSGGTCDKHAGIKPGEKVWGCTEDIVKQGCYDRCILDITCKSQFKCLDVNGTKRCVNPSCIESESCACASPSPSPSPTPTPTPTPSPSPSPTVCVALTKDTVAPKLNDTVTFTCTGANFSSAAPVAQFRTSFDDGVTFNTPTSPKAINLTTNTATEQFIISQTGDWEVQCRVCTDNTTTTCTAWGKAL